MGIGVELAVGFATGDAGRSFSTSATGEFEGSGRMTLSFVRAFPSGSGVGVLPFAPYSFSETKPSNFGRRFAIVPPLRTIGAPAVTSSCPFGAGSETLLPPKRTLGEGVEMLELRIRVPFPVLVTAPEPVTWAESLAIIEVPPPLMAILPVESGRSYVSS